MLGSIFQDLQFAVRTFRRSPGFTFAVLITLALGIGANTAIFSVVDGALLHPVPFPDSDRLASLYQTFPQGGDKNAVSYLNLLDWQQQSRTFEAIAGVRAVIYTLTGRGDPEQLVGLGVSSDLTSVLRTQPLLGRMFTRKRINAAAGLWLFSPNAIGKVTSRATRRFSDKRCGSMDATSR